MAPENDTTRITGEIRIADESRNDEYDSPWKDVSAVLLPYMIALLFPKIFLDIDWSRNWESLDQELAKLFPDSEVGNRRADKLFRVYRGVLTASAGSCGASRWGFGSRAPSW